MNIDPQAIAAYLVKVATEVRDNVDAQGDVGNFLLSTLECWAEEEGETMTNAQISAVQTAAWALLG